MCGLAAYVGSRADPDTLRDAILGAASRGPDMHGWAVTGEPTERRDGPLTDSIDQLATAITTPAIYHARLATTGRVDALTDCQPLDVAGWRWAHNGVVPTPIWQALRSRCSTENDSEAIAHIALEQTIALALSQLRRYAVIALSPSGQLLASRSWLPLYALTDRTGTYLSSRELAGGTALDERMIYIVTGSGLSAAGAAPDPIEETRWRLAGT